MTYVFDFGWIGQYWAVLVHGIWVTVQLTIVGGVLGVGVGLACAWARTGGPVWLRVPVVVYVELIRNTPFLVQLFFIFFGLPGLGIQLTAMQAASLAMVLNLGAYSAEIIRAGIEATPRGHVEAGLSLAMSRVQVFRHIIVLPAFQRIWPALSSQIVIVMLGSAVVSQIAATDLTYAANYIQTRNFRAFEVYFVTIGIYLVLTILLRRVLDLIGWWLFPRTAR